MLSCPAEQSIFFTVVTKQIWVKVASALTSVSSAVHFWIQEWKIIKTGLPLQNYHRNESGTLSWHTLWRTVHRHRSTNTNPRKLFPFLVRVIFAFATALRRQIVQSSCQLTLQLSPSSGVRQVTGLSTSRSDYAVAGDRQSRLAPRLVAAAVRLGHVMGETEHVSAVGTHLTEHRCARLAPGCTTPPVIACRRGHQRIEIVLIHTIQCRRRRTFLSHWRRRLLTKTRKIHTIKNMHKTSTETL